MTMDLPIRRLLNKEGGSTSKGWPEKKKRKEKKVALGKWITISKEYKFVERLHRKLNLLNLCCSLIINDFDTT